MTYMLIFFFFKCSKAKSLFTLTIWHKIVHTYNQNQNHMMQKKASKNPWGKPYFTTNNKI